jgi:hypothetical protein
MRALKFAKWIEDSAGPVRYSITSSASKPNSKPDPLLQGGNCNVQFTNGGGRLSAGQIVSIVVVPPSEGLPPPDNVFLWIDKFRDLTDEEHPIDPYRAAHNIWQPLCDATLGIKLYCMQPADEDRVLIPKSMLVSHVAICPYQHRRESSKDRRKFIAVVGLERVG